jgi:hypothetical protein
MSWLNAFSRKDAKDWYELYVAKIPERLQVLQGYVNSTPGFEAWELGYEPETVRMLERWFIGHVELRLQTTEELEQYYASVPERFKNLPTIVTTLTDETNSLVVDMSMYFGEYMRHEDTGLQWNLCVNGKKNVEYQNPVIVGSGFIPQNPRGLMDVFALKVGDKTQKPDYLINLKNTWIPILWLERKTPPKKEN